MSTRGTPEIESDTIADELVESFLKAHPDFFTHRGELLASLSIPHVVGSAVSLIERQVEVLRSKNQQLEAKLIELVEVARSNEKLSARLHRLSLGLLEAEKLDDVLSFTQDILRNEFPATHVHVCLSQDYLEWEDPRGMSSELLSSEILNEIFETNRPMFGISDEHKEMYFSSTDDKIASSVLIPLTDGRKLGVLALGSQEPDRFLSGMGTLFLEHLGELISRAISSRLAL